jgi:hypothetical protein
MRNAARVQLAAAPWRDGGARGISTRMTIAAANQRLPSGA